MSPDELCTLIGPAKGARRLTRALLHGTRLTRAPPAYINYYRWQLLYLVGASKTLFAFRLAAAAVAVDEDSVSTASGAEHAYRSGADVFS